MSEISLDGTAINALIAQGKALCPVQAAEGRAPFVILPQPDGDYIVEYLKPREFDPLPDHIRQRVTLVETESFIAYVKLFKQGTTRIFATPLDPSALTVESIRAGKSAAAFTAILDYHEQGSEATPKRVAHVATYPLPLSLEFKIWLSQNKEALSQDAFIQFIDDNQLDIAKPEAAALMDMVANFESKSEVVFKSAVQRINGARQLVFNERVEMNGGGFTAGEEKKITVPEFLELSIPIFEGGIKIPVKARMEYRPTSGKLKVTYHLHRPHEILRNAFADIRAHIESADQGVDIPILTGSAAIPGAIQL